MGMAVATTGKGARPEINVTPLVDVVLVLLIIFMVITPLLTKHLPVSVPDEPDAAAPTLPPDAKPPLFVRLTAEGRVLLNQEPVDAAELSNRLRRAIAAQADGTVFFDADTEANYGEAVRLMDLARTCGAKRVAPVARALGSQP